MARARRKRKGRKGTRSTTSSSNWIQRAIKHPGSLTEWFKRNRSRLKRKLGYDPITRRGDIRDKAINDTIRLAKQGKLKLSNTTLRRLYLAKTLQRLRKKKKR